MVLKADGASRFASDVPGRFAPLFGQLDDSSSCRFGQLAKLASSLVERETFIVDRNKKRRRRFCVPTINVAVVCDIPTQDAAPKAGKTSTCKDRTTASRKATTASSTRWRAARAGTTSSCSCSRPVSSTPTRTGRSRVDRAVRAYRLGGVGRSHRWQTGRSREPIQKGRADGIKSLKCHSTGATPIMAPTSTQRDRRKSTPSDAAIAMPLPTSISGR